MKTAFAPRLLLLLFAAEAVLALPSARARAADALELSALGISVQAAAWNDVRIIDGAGTVVATLTGLRPSWKPAVRVKGGTVRSTTNSDGSNAIEIVYQFEGETDAAVPEATCRIAVAPGRADVRFDISGLPADAKAGGTLFGRRLPKEATAVPTDKIGLWQRHAYGGVPYEIPDGRLVRYRLANEAVAFGFANGTSLHPEWQDGQALHAALVQESPGHWVSAISVLIAPADRSSEALAAQWHGRPLGLRLATDQPYNWWTDNQEPLVVKPVLTNVSPEARQVEYACRARDFSGAVVAEDRRTLTLQPGESYQTPFPVPAAPRDLLFVEVSAKDAKTGQETFSRTNLTVLPPHEFKSTPDDSLFGISAYWPVPSEADAQRVMRRMGVRWIRNGDTRVCSASGMVANHQSAAKLDMPQPQRDEFIRKELQTCVERQNPYWEFMNEINFAGGGIGMGDAGIGKATAIANYVQWLKDIRRVQQETGLTQVKLMSAATAGMDVVFVQKLYEAGGWPLLDAMALHPGRGNFAPDYGAETPYPQWGHGDHGSYWNYYGSVRTAMATLKKYGEKPLWLTEVYTPTFPNSWWEDTLRASAENVVLQYALAAAEGVRCAMYYQLFDGVYYDRLGVDPKEREYHFGMINRDLSFKPALLGYCAIAEALDQARFVRALSFKDPLDRGLLFSTPRGPVAVLWNRADGYILTQKADHYASPEPWIDGWKTRTPLELPAAGGSLTVANAIGQSREIPVRDGTARIELTGAPAIVTGIDAERLP